MGATIHGRQKDTLPPLSILGGSLRGLDYTLPVPSAQLKSCLLLAGLLATDKTVIREPTQSRDHTERMLINMGADLTVLGDTITISPSSLQAQDFIIPGDISSGAFWIVAGVVHSNARILIRNVGINQTRRGLIDVLLQMGGNLSIENERFEGGEEVAALGNEPGRMEGMDLRLVMSHLACAENQGSPMNEGQLLEFLRQKAALKPAPASLAASAGIFLGAGYHFEWVRPGIALYGGNPTPNEPNPMAEVVQIKGKILQVRDVDSPQTVGYGAAF